MFVSDHCIRQSPSLHQQQQQQTENAVDSETKSRDVNHLKPDTLSRQVRQPVTHLAAHQSTWSPALRDNQLPAALNNSCHQVIAPTQFCPRLRFNLFNST